MTDCFNLRTINVAFQNAARAFDFKETIVHAAQPVGISAFSKPSLQPHIYLSAGIHGDEPAGPMAMLELLEEGFFDDRASWTLCPLLNPSGLEMATRENADGLDLNRDYFERGSAEISAHALWLEGQKAPDLFLSLHEDWESTGFYLYEINVHDRHSFALQVLDRVADILPIEPNAVVDDHETRELGWIYHPVEPDMPDHWPEAIFVAKHGCPLSFTLETPSSLDLRKRIDAHKVAVREAVKLFLV